MPRDGWQRALSTVSPVAELRHIVVLPKMPGTYG